MGKQTLEIPELQQLQQELCRDRNKQKFWKISQKTALLLLMAVFATVLIGALVMPVIRIRSDSMYPTLREGAIVAAVRDDDVQPGDVIAFYSGSTLQIKRVICGPGSTVDIDENGRVYVDGAALEEPYVLQQAMGSLDVQMPFQVPPEQYFVMGDHRVESVDSRNTAVGCVPKEQIVGKIVACIWPLESFGLIEWGHEHE